MIKTTNIGVIGYGIVGHALAYGFSNNGISKNYQILYFDKYQKSQPLKTVINKSNFIFICLPTPMKADESGIDLGIIEDTIKKIVPQTNGTDKIIVIKSTIVPGTTQTFEKLYPKTNFCFNPEFLTEANYLEDFLNTDRTIIGASKDSTSIKVTSLYRERFPKMKIFQTDPTSAEMVKYMANTYLAMKVTFANEIFDLCNKLGIEYGEVKKMVIADHRIYDSHLDITSLRGFGGKCFPKDIVAILGLADQLGIELSILKTVWEKNKKIRKVHDWDEIPFAVSGKKATRKN